MRASSFRMDSATLSFVKLEPSTLIATGMLSNRSCALYTVPMPPSPRISSSLYRPPMTLSSVSSEAVLFLKRPASGAFLGLASSPFSFFVRGDLCDDVISRASFWSCACWRVNVP